jgi:hypothetical protein
MVADHIPSREDSIKKSRVSLIASPFEQFAADRADASKACDYLHSLENGKVKSEVPGPFTERLDAAAQERQARSR